MKVRAGGFISQCPQVGCGTERAMAEMTSTAVIELLHLFESAGVEVWLDGGWGVDALLEVQTRPHNDVDIVVRLSDAPRLCEVLSSRAFNVRLGGTGSSFVLENLSGLEVDVHASPSTSPATAFIACKAASTGFIRRLGSSVKAQSVACQFAASPPRRKCWAMRKVIFLRRRMSPTWRTFEVGLVLSCRHTCDARNAHRISRRLTNHARQRYRAAVPIAAPRGRRRWVVWASASISQLVRSETNMIRLRISIKLDGFDLSPAFPCGFGHAMPAIHYLAV